MYTQKERASRWAGKTLFLEIKMAEIKKTLYLLGVEKSMGSGN